MEVIIFGATGSVGKLAVRDVLDAGHAVTAFARSPEKIGFEHPALTLVAGDASGADTVREAIRGHDAVIVTIGAGASRKSRIRSEATMNVIRGMQETGVRRLISQSTLGAHESWSNLNFFWKRIMFGFLLKPVFRDHELQESLVRASGLDWTIVRPGAFTDGPAAGTYLEDFPPEERRLSLKIPRADIAGFLRRQLTETRYLHRAVAISQ